jgi:antitoxin component of MazEF toxin-antitoxin module
MIVKNLVQHGNSKALIIDKSILQAAGLNEDALFQIVVDSNFGITIQSVKPVNNQFKESKEKILRIYSKTIKNLADR